MARSKSSSKSKQEKYKAHFAKYLQKHQKVKLIRNIEKDNSESVF